VVAVALSSPLFWLHVVILSAAKNPSFFGARHGLEVWLRAGRGLLVAITVCFGFTSSSLFWLYAVILRACDFFDFSQKAALKTTGLDAKKSSYRNKVTSSERSEESLILWCMALALRFGFGPAVACWWYYGLFWLYVVILSFGFPLSF